MERRCGSVLLNHHLGSFYHGDDGIALFELEFVGAAARNCTLNQVVPDSNDYMGHHFTELNFFDFSAQFVSG